MGKPILLDLFCGAGGAARGYQRAGFSVIGVDINPQPHYAGDEFCRDDALRVLDVLLAGGVWNGHLLHDFSAVHESVPCQSYSVSKGLSKGTAPRLIESTRETLRTTGLPYVIENVAGAWKSMPGAIMLCGTHFGLKIYRHRLFESNMMLFAPRLCSHPRHLMPGYVCIYGHVSRRRQHGNTGNRYERVPIDEARRAMGIEWMTRLELAQAIPPAYTEWLGQQLMNVVICSAA